MGRSPCCDKTKVKRGPWSPDEDSALKNYVQKYGTGGNWIALPHKAGLKRCGKSCRLRWLNYLRPDIKHGAFTKEEDEIILTLYSNIGSRWSVIASHLPGRTDNDVKNHWNTKLKKKLMAAQKTILSSATADSQTTLSSATAYSETSNLTALARTSSEASTTNYYSENWFGNAIPAPYPQVIDEQTAQILEGNGQISVPSFMRTYSDYFGFPVTADDVSGQLWSSFFEDTGSVWSNG
ncbi:hypothetical protein F511_17649 [Dorcoceras hygrometricum]|uniref:Uncharacterized protein n=1 Tax=Dorcoceras hygrometricum TaxID=472368 RepID=A0A2Z7AIN2_9LAMI|nr:hypothetical protein F511_17649 [Dorcoceras hygrometricum]